MDFINWLYPKKCMVCSSILDVDARHSFCESCEGEVTKVGDIFCVKCGTKMNSNRGSELCENCKRVNHRFVFNRSIFCYDENIKKVIYKFKYGNHAGFGRELGKLMAEQYDSLMETGIDVIMPVPLHHSRFNERGFNQAALLAKEISKVKQIPYDDSSLIRVKNTVPQSSLNHLEREKNIGDAFKISDDSKFNHNKILLIDDIFTTGSTLNSCTNVLLNSRKHTSSVQVFSFTLAIV